MKRAQWSAVIVVIAAICCISAAIVILSNEGQDSGSKVHYTVTKFEVYEESPVSGIVKIQENLRGGEGLVVAGNEDKFIWIHVEANYEWTDGDEVPAYLALKIQYKQTESDTISTGTFYTILGETYPFVKCEKHTRNGFLFLVPIPYENGVPMVDIQYEKVKTNTRVWIEDN